MNPGSKKIGSSNLVTRKADMITHFLGSPPEVDSFVYICQNEHLIKAVTIDFEAKPADMLYFFKHTAHRKESTHQIILNGYLVANQNLFDRDYTLFRAVSLKI